MNFDIDKVINELKTKQLYFVSERQLQIEFTIAAQRIYPNYSFMPEYVYHDANNQIYHIDLMISDGLECLAFEFKYVVAGGTIKVPGDSKYILRNHSAIDIRRYQCVKDISRLEEYKNIKGCSGGYLLLITNMAGFWNGSDRSKACVELDIREGFSLNVGSHEFLGDTYVAKTYPPIQLTNSYEIHYFDYLDNHSKLGLFKYLVVKV